MPSFSEIVKVAVCQKVVELRGLKIQVTERLYRDPQFDIDNRARMQGLLTDASALLSRIKTPLPSAGKKKKTAADEDEASFAQFEQMVAAAKLQADVDPREQAVSACCARVLVWDLTDEKGAPLPLEADALYQLRVPTELFEEFLAELEKTPIVPNEKA